MKNETPRGHHLLVDNDSVYATSQAIAPACTLTLTLILILTLGVYATSQARGLGWG